MGLSRFPLMCESGVGKKGKKIRESKRLLLNPLAVAKRALKRMIGLKNHHGPFKGLPGRIKTLGLFLSSFVLSCRSAYLGNGLGLDFVRVGFGSFFVNQKPEICANAKQAMLGGSDGAKLNLLRG